MIAEWVVTLRTGYDLSDNERKRISELIADKLGEIRRDYLADAEVRESHFIPGPRTEVVPDE
jgi:hypothetical protein